MRGETGGSTCDWEAPGVAPTNSYMLVKVSGVGCVGTDARRVIVQEGGARSRVAELCRKVCQPAGGGQGSVVGLVLGVHATNQAEPHLLLMVKPIERGLCNDLWILHLRQQDGRIACMQNPQGKRRLRELRGLSIPAALIRLASDGFVCGTGRGVD